MPGHLYEITELFDNISKTYRIVTNSNNEEAARRTFERSLGSRKNIYECKYIGFVHACEGG